MCCWHYLVRISPLLFVAILLSEIILLHELHQTISIPLVSTNCYRYYGSPIRETIIHNINVNMSLIDEYYSLWGAPKYFHFNDTKVPYYTPNPVDSVLNRDVNVCSNDTFLLMMIPIRRDDSALRQILRRAIPQGIVIQGKRINRIFVVAVADHERDAMKRIRREKELYGDIVISRHSDAYAKIHLSTWDGYVWVREHCRSATFTGKFDPDAIHFLGNYISLLLQYPTKRFYGGRLFEATVEPRNAKRKPVLRNAPFDYPDSYATRFEPVCGAATIISVDVIDYIMFGTMYEPYFVPAEDTMTGLILKRFGVLPVVMGTDNCPFLIEWHLDCDKKYKNRSLLPACIGAYHPVKNLKEYKQAVSFFGEKLYSSQVIDRVDLTKPIRQKSCY